MKEQHKECQVFDCQESGVYRDHRCHECRTQPAPKLDGDLVKRMCKASDAAQDDCIGSEARAMAAALSVAMDAMLGPVTDEERKQHSELVMFWPAAMDVLLSARRERLTAKPKTAEERVTVTEDAKWARVFVDGVKKYSFEQSENGEELASALREGLIARMKREQIQP